MRRPRRVARFLSEPRYSLSTYSSSPPAESSNELRRVAALPLPGRRTARIKEPQKHDQELSPILSCSACRLGDKAGDPKGSQEHCPSPRHLPRQNSRPILGPARRENRFRFSRLKNRHGPKLAPVLRPVSASLRLRCRSAAFSVARGNSCRIGRVPTGRICPLKRAGDGVFGRVDLFACLRDSLYFGSPPK